MPNNSRPGKLITASKKQYTDTLIRQLAIKNLEVEELKRTAENNSGTRRSKAKQAKNQNRNAAADNAGVEREIARLRRQMAVQNAYKTQRLWEVQLLL